MKRHTWCCGHRWCLCQTTMWTPLCTNSISTRKRWKMHCQECNVHLFLCGDQSDTQKRPQTWWSHGRRLTLPLRLLPSLRLARIAACLHTFSDKQRTLVRPGPVTRSHKRSLSLVSASSDNNAQRSGICRHQIELHLIALHHFCIPWTWTCNRQCQILTSSPGWAIGRDPVSEALPFPQQLPGQPKRRGLSGSGGLRCQLPWLIRHWQDVHHASTGIRCGPCERRILRAFHNCSPAPLWRNPLKKNEQHCLNAAAFICCTLQLKWLNPQNAWVWSSQITRNTQMSWKSGDDPPEPQHWSFFLDWLAISERATHQDAAEIPTKATSGWVAFCPVKPTPLVVSEPRSPLRIKQVHQLARHPQMEKSFLTNPMVIYFSIYLGMTIFGDNYTVHGLLSTFGGEPCTGLENAQHPKPPNTLVTCDPNHPITFVMKRTSMGPSEITNPPRKDGWRFLQRLQGCSNGEVQRSKRPNAATQALQKTLCSIGNQVLHL